MHQHLLLAANRCSIRYDKFPYPLSDIRGTLEMFDGNWTFRNLEGSNDKARVTCEGQLTPGLQGNELVLNFDGQRRAAGRGPPRRAEPAHPAGLARPAAPRRGRPDGRGPLPAGAEEVQRGRAGQAATRERLDRARPLPLSPRPSPRRARLPRRARHLRALQGRARIGQGFQPKAIAISCPTGGGTSTSPGCRPIGSTPTAS